MTCFCFCSKREEEASSIRQTVEIDKEVAAIETTKVFTYKELQRATENFRITNKIGEGGFGSVFKGRLRDGTLVAIKVLAADSRQGVREFLNEIKVIADIEHENLVRLLGCCVEGDQRILVYGYLENNSLAQTLLGGNGRNLQFSWHTRCSICIGIAKGLVFLHEEVEPHIIHRDVKASNILLDKDLTAKISDFGLAKLFPSNLTHVSTRVAGTAGYLAPEYAIRGQLTRKADVYSFGVLLLEIVSGRANTNRRLRPQEQYLIEWAWELYERGELGELVDPLLKMDYNIEEANKYLKIGLLCVQEEPKLRPSMSRVVKMLTGQIDLTGKEISRPGLLSEMISLKVQDEHKDSDLFNTNKVTGATSSSRGNLFETSSEENMTTSHGTMTFQSIYERSD